MRRTLMLDGFGIIRASLDLPADDRVSQLFGEKKKLHHIYGFHIDPSKSDPAEAVTYLADAVGKTPAAMGASYFSYGDWADAFFMPRPCMLRYDGTVAYYLDPDDYTKKADGTPSDVGNASFEGNAMMEWPLIWYKFVQGEAEGEGCFYCSDIKADDSYKCWCNINAQDEITKHFYTSIYNGVIISGKTRSLSGVSLSDPTEELTSTSEDISYAVANNTSSSVEWYTGVFSDRQLINALIVLIGKSLDTQSTFGQGICSASSGNYNTGTLDSAGLFSGSVSDGISPVKVFGMENWWGYAHHHTAGLIRDSSRKYKYKLTFGTADGSSVTGYNPTGSGYIDSGVTLDPAYALITKMKFGLYGMLPFAGINDTSRSTYYCDETAVSNSVTGYANYGGMYNNGNKVGAFLLTTYFDASYKTMSASPRLSCKPIA